MTTTPTPPMEDDVKAIRDALSANPTPGPWGLGNADGFAAIVRNEAGDIITPTGPRTADATYIAACHPARIARLLAHIDAQALRLEAAERDAVRADVAMLRGSRKVLWNLLGECLPLLHQIECHDAESDERLGFLIGQIESARSQVQAEELPGRI